jgi:hypothetical protein
MNDDIVVHFHYYDAEQGGMVVNEDPTHLVEMLNEAADEIERLRRPSWDDLMAIVDEIYPADVFDGSSGDEGPRTLTLMREIERLRSLITAWADAWDEQGADVQGQGSYHDVTVRRIDTGDALRKAVGR